MALLYVAQPLKPTVIKTGGSKIAIKNLQFDFWSFLNSNIFKQLEILSFMILRKRGVIYAESWKDVNIEYKHFETDSLEETITKHAIGFINAFGEEPEAILVGFDIHNQLMSSPSIVYQQQYRYGWRHSIHVAEIKVILVLTMEGFLLLPKKTWNPGSDLR